MKRNNTKKEGKSSKGGKRGEKDSKTPTMQGGASITNQKTPAWYPFRDANKLQNGPSDIQT